MDTSKFLKDLKSTVNKVTQSAKKNLPKYAESVKDTASKYGKIGKETINIKIYQGKINTLYEKIGKYVYDNRDNREVSDLARILKTSIADIDKNLAKIAGLNKKISDLQKVNKARTAKPKSTAKGKSTVRRKMASKKG